MAGLGGRGYNGDNIPATEARLALPAGVAVDAAGNVFIADTFNQRIRRVDATGRIATVAGTGVGGYDGDDKPATERTLWLRTALVGKPGDKLIEITIEDAGHGINEDIRDRMFEPFISTKHTVGVGMGLTVARHALRNLGGDVHMHDRPGGGATAVLTHPVERKLKTPA